MSEANVSAEDRARAWVDAAFRGDPSAYDGPDPEDVAAIVAQADRVAELEAAPRADNIPRDTDEKPSDAMPAAGFADWRESSEWWQSTCEYWKARADALARDGGGADG